MRKEIALKLSANNLHLRNIFTDDHYVELGNIDISVMERILKKEIIKIEEIAYFPIQNKGLGRSSSENELLKNILPYVYFKNLNKKNETKQLFITYGILKYVNSEKKESFIPIVLLPINIYFENDNVYVQLFSEPLENPFLLKVFNDSNKNVELMAEKLDSIYDIDKLCMSFDKIEPFDLRLENYLTFANVKRKELIIDSSRFELNSDSNAFTDKLYPYNNVDIYYSDLLSRKQRKAVLNSLEGHSFSITGRNGTGKTLTLKNILINAINHSKRVLYISNMKETLDGVEEFLKEKGLEKYVANFSNSFAELFDEKDNANIEEVNNDFSYDMLKENYQYINDYENKMSERLHDYRFIEVIDKLSFLSLKDSKKLEIGDLSHIYKNEAEKIFSELELIQTTLDKIPSFKDCIWSGIPISNAITYPDHIISLVKEIYNCFILFREEKKVLEKKYLTKEIDNYAMFKNVIFHIENLDIDTIPDTWKEPSLVVFNEAKNSYKNLKNDIYQFQEAQYTLNHKFTNLSSISINKEISCLLGNYFTRDDAALINNLLNNRSNITVRINRGLYQKENFEKSVQVLQEFTNWNFSQDNRAAYEVLRLADFLSTNSLNRRIVNIITNNQYDKTYEKLQECIYTINKTTENINIFNEEHPKLDSALLKEILLLIEEYETLTEKEKKDDSHIGPMIKKKLGGGDLENLIFKVKNYINNTRSLRQAKDVYYDLIREKYSQEDDACEKLRIWKAHLDTIKDKNTLANIAKFLYKLSEKDVSVSPDLQKIWRALNTYRKSFYELEDLMSNLDSYHVGCKEKIFTNKVIELEKIVNYIRNLYASNDRMKNVYKTKDEEYISAEIYILLEHNWNERNSIKSRLNNNQNYIKIYGKLYQEENTDITLISKVMQNYESFCSSFASGIGFINATKAKVNSSLMRHLYECKKVSDNINETFKLYCRIFKDGVSRYYYTSFDENIVYLNKLLNSKKELLLYLTIAKGIMTLNKYKLFDLVDYIVNTDKVENLVDNFKYTYFTMLEEMFFKDYPELVDNETVLKKLKETIEIEIGLIKKNEYNIVNKIRRNSSSKGYVAGVRNLDYQAYVRRTNGLKHVFLTTSSLANLYLDKEAYDLILIDDAHLLTANEYGDFVNGKQVIVAGELQYHASVSNSLISRMRTVSTIVLDYRYIPMPCNLQDNCQEINGIIKNHYQDNIGLEIVEKDLFGYIYNIYRENNNVVINYFVNGIKKQRDFSEQLANYLSNNGVSAKDIVAVLMKNINICDLAEEYIYQADYNIIDFEDYFDIDVDYICDDMISSLLLCKNKLVIFDRNDLLVRDYDFRFFKGIKRILDSRKNIFTGLNYSNVVMECLANELSDREIRAICGANNFIYRIDSEGKIDIVMVLWGNNCVTETMNIYRDVYRSYIDNGWKISLLNKNKLGTKIKDVILSLKSEENV